MVPRAGWSAAGSVACDPQAQYRFPARTALCVTRNSELKFV